MELSLLPPTEVAQEADDAITKVEQAHSQGKVKLSDDQIKKLERDIYRMVERWKEGTGVLRERLKEYNDLMEGVVEETNFPWPGASKAAMGMAAGMARTLQATFDRSIFSQERTFVAENIRAAKKADANKLEEAVNWLATRQNNLVDILKDLPFPLFRDGTVPVMGEWERRIERACDYKTYQDAASFQLDYPTPDDAGMSPVRYQGVIKHLTETMDPDLVVEYTYDEIVYDAPRFTLIPLARFLFYPLSIEELDEAIIYGRQFYESPDDMRTKAKFGEYDIEATDEAIKAAKGSIDDFWGQSREFVEGVNSSGDDHKRCECFRIVLKQDLDGDRIPEKYLITYEHVSKRILNIRRYPLRRNIDNIVMFRFIKRDGRLLGVSLCGNGYDKFRLIDDFHRHRQNVRSITDCPAFLAPERMKETIDFGGVDMAWRPGATIWLPDDYMAPDRAPRQMQVQNLDRYSNGMDEEGMVMRYIEIELGPSQGMSGKETAQDPKQPATKTLALLRQSTFRVDAYINEFRHSIPKLMKLHNALYYQYGPRLIDYMTKVSGTPFQGELERGMFALDAMEFNLKVTELSLSPEYQIEKAQAITMAAAQNPMVLQLRPDIMIEAWNEFIWALRPTDPQKFIIEKPAQGTAGALPLAPAPMGGPVDLPAILQQKLQEAKANGGQKPNAISGKQRKAT